MPKSRFVTDLKGGRPRAVDSPLGPLPERGLYSDQVEMVKETVESGKLVVGARSFHGKGLAAAADELQIAKTTLKLRLLECGKEITETPTFKLEVLDMSVDGADSLAAWLETLPQIEAVASADVAAFTAQLHAEAKSLLPVSPRMSDGFTHAQSALLDKIVRGLRIGANGAAPFLVLNNAASVVQRLKVMNLRIAGVYEYKLEAAQR